MNVNELKAHELINLSDHTSERVEEPIHSVSDAKPLLISPDHRILFGYDDYAKFKHSNISDVPVYMIQTNKQNIIMKLELKGDIKLNEKKEIAKELYSDVPIEYLSSILGVRQAMLRGWAGEASPAFQNNKIITRENIMKIVKNPKYFWDAISLIKSEVSATNINRKYYSMTNKSSYFDKGINIFDEDWDIMIILDACRYDKFKKLNDLRGDLEYRYSKASMTHEWVYANFEDKSLDDVVYVFANGVFSKFEDNINTSIFKTIPVWKERTKDEEVSMEKTTEMGIQANEEYPNKRLLIHYIPPHIPYIGSKAEDLNQEVVGIREIVHENDLDKRELHELYEQNVDLVINEVSELITELSGKTVITSDHGEMLGERQHPVPARGYGHPSGVYTPELVKIPWFVVEYEERRQISSSKPIHEEGKSIKGNLQDHLKALGYK